VSLQWTRPPSQAWGELAGAYVAAIRRAVRTLADRYAPEIESHMKREAVWVDRTGNARATLSVEVEQLTLDMVEIQLAGGVEYFVYLELSNGGRFSIISPTIDIYGPRIWNDVRTMLS
jgi:hypothetical protein